MSDLRSLRPARSQRVVLGLVTIALTITGIALIPPPPMARHTPIPPRQAKPEAISPLLTERQAPDPAILSAYRNAGVSVKTPTKSSANGSVYFAPSDPEARHEWELMHHARIRAYSPSPSPDARLISLGTDKDRATYAYHREKLVKSGHLAKLNVKFKHLLRGTKESNHFLKLLMKDECPELLDLESLYRTDLQPLEMTIWYAPGLVQEWEQFLAEHDRSNLDYNLRFMSFNKDSESD
jgi:hypothetical protein